MALSEPPARAARVLVVDDEPNISALLSATLRLVEFEVRVVDSGHRALVAVDQNGAKKPRATGPVHDLAADDLQINHAPLSSRRLFVLGKKRLQLHNQTLAAIEGDPEVIQDLNADKVLVAQSKDEQGRTG